MDFSESRSPAAISCWWRRRDEGFYIFYVRFAGICCGVIIRTQLLPIACRAGAVRSTNSMLYGRIRTTAEMSPGQMIMNLGDFSFVAA